MRCYALAMRRNDENDFTWHIPQLSFSAFFNITSYVQQMVVKSKTQIDGYCEKLKLNETKIEEKEGYYFSIRCTRHGYCVVVTDNLLDEKQVSFLTWYILDRSIPLETVASDFEKHTHDYKVHELQQKVLETHKIATDNLVKLQERGVKLETLVAKTKELETSSFTFNKKSKELNSCWPSCNIL